jgi:glutathione S-transferase
MAGHSEKFVLRSTATSPFGRKVRMAIDLLGLGDRVMLVPADTLDESDTLRQQNPLGKMPCLLLGDGTSIYDSGVIVEYLQEMTGDERLIPARGLPRYKALTLARLADGITDASILVIYDDRFRPGQPPAEFWLAHQRGKITRGLAAFEAKPPAADKTDIVSIGLACALGYLDWRKPVDWRPSYPGLVEWLSRFAAHEPAFERTRASNS